MKIHSDELRRLQEQDDMFYLSHSYLSSCQFLCNAMVTGDFEPDFARTRILLNLCHHGLELFYKAALLAVGYPYKKGHNLKEMRNAFVELYPDRSFEIPMPFGYEALGFDELYPDWERKHFNSLHERFRYSSDNKGRRWPDIEGFDVNEFLVEIDSLVYQTLQVWVAIRNKK